LIADAGGGQDQLPLIQHGLMVLSQPFFDAKKPWRLSIAVYEPTGGLSKSLADHAVKVIRDEHLPVDTVEQLFRALTDINSDAVAIRRPCKLGDIIKITGASEASLRSIIDAFRKEGVSFLRPYGTGPVALDERIDISHEALIRCWDRLAN